MRSTLEILHRGGLRLARVNSRIEEWGRSRKVRSRFSRLHTPSKNPRPISRMQAYIACLLVVTFDELTFYEVLGTSETASLPLEQHYSSTAMASISTSCPSTASMDTPNSVLAAPAIPDCCTATHTDPRSARSLATT